MIAEIVIIGLASLLMPVIKFGLDEFWKTEKIISSPRPPFRPRVRTAPLVNPPGGASGQSRPANVVSPRDPMPKPPKGPGGVARVQIRPDERLKRKGY